MNEQNLRELETKILNCVHYSPHSLSVKPNQALELIAYILAIQAQPTPSQSEVVATDAPKKIYLQLSDEPISYQQAMQDGDVSWCAKKVFEHDIEYQLVEPNTATQAQPTSQEYCCIDSWEYAKNKAWNNRNYSLCKCDHNESCDYCFPSDFKDGGKWALCKPSKEAGL